MGVVKEFNCIEHGDFEGTHPICPEYGCRSRHVARVFLTPVSIGSRMVKQHDAGMKRSAEMMGISNFRTAREGEAAYGGDQRGSQGDLGVLWGDECKKKMGRSFAELTGLAQKPLVVKKRDGSGELRLDRNNAMREAATEAGITQRRLPKAAELAVPKADRVAPEKIAAITA